MEDFGSGYSSFSYLQNFRFDRIKIDRCFVRTMHSDPGALNLVRAITAMARGLGMATGVEGVETAEELDVVKSEGCTEIQGFYFSPPVRAEEIAQLLAEREAARKCKNRERAA